MNELQIQPQLTIPRVIGCLSFFNADNLEIMRGFADNEFDLAIVDPPYGIDINPNMGIKKGQKKRHNAIKWDKDIPTQEYFNELFRVSKNQIIWGGNYFPLPPTRHFIFWDKMNPEGLSFSDGEMAWTSFNKAIRKWSRRNAIDGKIHPTQKPIELYDWILRNYSEPNAKILDTHLGSGSIAIAVEKANRLDKMNLQFIGIEIDKEYFEKALNRIEQYTRQGPLSF
jgi:site-specific DNA-methyltransferase (adenine-specific)